ncbi:MAG TPA: response regulator [Anaerolineae bacterium]|nr:response regulator [Anaerolineae bacterium]HMR65154.1 response regulator [Anaerolineae bacterium]
MPTLLLVEDDPLLRNWLAYAFKNLNLDVRLFIASNGAEAWQLLQQNPVDLLWTDYEMPSLNGATLIRRAVGQYPHLPVVLMSGNLSAAQAAVADLGIQVLAKPFTLEDIQQVLTSLLTDFEGTE